MHWQFCLMSDAYTETNIRKIGKESLHYNYLKKKKKK